MRTMPSTSLFFTNSSSIHPRTFFKGGPSECGNPNIQNAVDIGSNVVVSAVNTEPLRLQLDTIPTTINLTNAIQNTTSLPDRCAEMKSRQQSQNSYGPGVQINSSVNYGGRNSIGRGVNTGVQLGN